MPRASKCAMRPLRATSVTAPETLPRVDVALHGLADALQPLRREADFLGLCRPGSFPPPAAVP